MTIRRAADRRQPSGPMPEITETDCERCGTRIAGLTGRYACGACGWVNHWSQGHTDLPSARDDLDYARRR
ncbi:hypothetical protein [Streptomyces sp. NPDC003036]|uniref:hypothetical protein n=1 Tax=Streptomyces sp. NPDC003036 TaxID=3154442 RepID=UPI0033A1217F